MTEKTVREDLKKYELMVIINPDIGSTAINKSLEEIKQLLSSKKSKGEIFFEDIWGVRDLAYKIKTHDAGYYAVYDFAALASSIAEIDTALRLDNDIIRHMIITLPDNYVPVSFADLEKSHEGDIIEERKPRAGRRKAPMTGNPAPRVEKKAEKEVSKEIPVSKAKKADVSMAEVDAKLKSIIDNPDINF